MPYGELLRRHVERMWIFGRNSVCEGHTITVDGNRGIVYLDPGRAVCS